MKSLTAVCQTGGAAGMPAINANGRISRPAHQRGDGENAEMKMYLSKLKDLVPFMPKNRKLSKLEIIQHVIDYICDLQTELETHPDVNNFDAASALNNYAAAAAAQADVVSNQVILSQRLNASEQQQTQQQQQQQQQHASPANLITNAVIRQPLVDRQTPNTILPTPAVATSSATITTITTPTTPTVHRQQQQSQTASTATTSASSLPSAAEKESKNSRLSSTAVNLF